MNSYLENVIIVSEHENCPPGQAAQFEPALGTAMTI